MPTIVAKTVLVNEQDKLLVLRRSQEDHHNPGRVDFPGGSVDPGEDIMQAAVREIEEESGVVVEPRGLVLAYAHTSGADQPEGMHRLLFIARVTKPVIMLSHEHDAYWWHDTAEVIAEFEQTSWVAGLQFALDHQLLPADAKSQRL